MDIATCYNLEHLENRGMRIVLDRVGAFLDEQPGFCRCEQCVFDLLAYTLNHVTPLYRASLLGSLASNDRLLQKLDIEIVMALEEGSKRVRRNPSHLEDAGG